MKKNILSLSLAYFALAMAALFLGNPSQAVAAPAPASVISNLGSWDGISFIDLWGGTASGYTPTYGETFQASAANAVLNSITFKLQNNSLSSINYQADVYAWNGSAITGSALFASAPLTIGNTGSSFLGVTVNTGSLALTPGSSYIALFTTIGQSNPMLMGGAAFGRVTSDAVPNSDFKYNSGTTLAALSGGNAWNDLGNFGELAFSMNFRPAAPAAAAVPDKGASVLLLGLGLAGLVITRRALGGRAVV